MYNKQYLFVLATEKGHINLVKLLVDNNSLINARDAYGNTALILGSIYKTPLRHQKFILIMIMSSETLNASIKLVFDFSFQFINYSISN